MTEADAVIFGTMICLAVVVALLSWYGIRINRQAEVEGGALTFDRLRTTVGPRVLPGPLIWGVWFAANSFNGLRLELKDRRDKPVTAIWFSPVPQDGVIQHFELEGTRYECVSGNLGSGRMWLRNASTGEVVLSARYRTLDVLVYQGKTDRLRVHIHRSGLISELGELTCGPEKLGHYFREMRCHACVISLHTPSLTVLEQCFTMLCMTRR